MWKYMLSRVVQIIVTLFVFFALTYFILDAQPGDISLQYITNPKFTPEMREALKRSLGLDRPVIERYFRWMGNTLSGNLGLSYEEKRPVTEIIGERAPRTLFLFGTALIIEFLIGYWLGKILAWSRGSAVEYGVTVVGAISYTIFTPWLALLMIWLFSFTLKWLPIGKFLDPQVWMRLPKDVNINSNTIFNALLLTATAVVGAVTLVYMLTAKMNKVKATRLRIELSIVIVAIAIGAWVTYKYGYLAADIFKHMVLPIVVLVLVNFAGNMLLTRTTMMETMREDYILAARAKGISERDVRDKHAARNAFLPVFTSMILTIPFIIGGGIITETVFSWPGMGMALLHATTIGDIPMIMGAFLFIGIFSLLAHFAADVAYAFLDPRIRYA
jgi:peptide/nickel transport system permease protein